MITVNMIFDRVDQKIHQAIVDELQKKFGKDGSCDMKDYLDMYSVVNDRLYFIGKELGEEIPHYGNERYVEVNRLISFVAEHGIKEILDIGAFKSQYHVPLMNKGCVITGVDLNPDPDPYIKIERYIVGDALSVDLPKSEIVVCVSSIEHLGFLCLRGQNTDVLKEQMIRRCSDLAKRYLYITFPFGASGHAVGFDNITFEETDRWYDILKKDWDINLEFWQNLIPGNDETWKRVDRDDADKIGVINEGRIVPCVGIMKGVRK